MARLIATKTEPKCAICKSPRRADADQWIARLGEKDGNGRTITWEVLCKDVMPLLLGRASIAQSSLKRHRQNHSRLVEDGEDGGEQANTPEWENDAETQAVLAEIRALAAQGHVPPSALLNLQQRLWLLTAKRKLENGERLDVTADQAARAADKLMQGEKTHEQALLLGALTGGIELAFKRSFSFGSHDDEVAELEAGEVIEEADAIPVTGAAAE